MDSHNFLKGENIMYCPDTLERMHEKLHQERVQALESGQEEVTCDYCGNKADHIIPVYNPADALREVEGIYCEVNICEKCEDKGYLYEEYFICDECGEWFILNHSWDSLVVNLNGSQYCHKCALNHLPTYTIQEVLDSLSNGETNLFNRINVPDSANLVWEGEFSQYSDFPGHTSFDSLIRSIKDKCEEDDISLETQVYSVVSHTYQFSVCLSIFSV